VIAGMKATGQTDVVVVDTVAAAMPGGNENSGEDLGKLIDYCKLIHRETGALVILIHHAGKDAAKGARGWSGLKAAADVEIEVTRKNEERRLRVSKLKDEADGDTVRFKLDRVVLGVNEFDEEESSCVISFDVKAERASATYKPRAPYQTGVMEIANASIGNEFDVKELTAAVLEHIPRGAEDDDDSRDQRGRSIGAAIKKLCAEKLLHVVPGSDGRRVSKSQLIQTAPAEGFDDSTVTNLGAAAAVAATKEES
jgi:hypothetical protein